MPKGACWAFMRFICPMTLTRRPKSLFCWLQKSRMYDQLLIKNLVALGFRNSEHHDAVMVEPMLIPQRVTGLTIFTDVKTLSLLCSTTN